MMTSVKAFLQNFIKYFLYIAVFAQIVSGTVYLVCNFSVYTIYPEVEEMVSAAKDLTFDEYTGFLYPLFIRMCLKIQNVFGIGYYLVAHLVQLVVSLLSSFYLAKPFFEGKRLWIAGLLVMTFPMCTQSILMVAPYAFKTSFGFFILGAMVRIWRKKDGLCIKSVVVMSVAYLLATFNQPEEVYLWIVPMVVLAVSMCFRKNDVLTLAKKLCILLAIVVVFLAALGVSTKVCEAGARGKMQRSVYSVMFQRTVWPNLGGKYSFLPVEVRSYFDQTRAFQSDSYAESILLHIATKVENGVGLERANELYKEAVISQFAYNKREIFKAVANDFVGYFLQPYSTVAYMNGQDGSAFGKLYGLLYDNEKTNPYDYFCISFVTLFSLSFVAILKAIKNRLFAKKGAMKNCILLIALLGYQAIWYAIVNVQGVDYRYVLLNVGIFILLAFKGSLFMPKERNIQ